MFCRRVRRVLQGVLTFVDFTHGKVAGRKTRVMTAMVSMEELSLRAARARSTEAFASL